MLNREEIFEICLEDYTQPRYKSAIRTYYGTEAEIHGLMDRLASSTTGAAVRYNETIEAVDYYGLDDEITHTVAGQTLPVLKPVEEICRFEAQLSEKYWNYTTHDGVTIPCYASKLDICQCLIGQIQSHHHDWNSGRKGNMSRFRICKDIKFSCRGCISQPKRSAH